MECKNILITGSTDGIGKITATALARQGHTIIIHGRNKEKAEMVRKQLIADLLSLADTKRASDEIKAKYDHLDVLINNAGAFFGKYRETTEEGFEKTIMLNLFAPFLLTQSLLELLEKSPSARIVNLSSAMHKRGGKPDFDDFQLKRSYRPDRAYGLAKLYLIWVSRHLADELRIKGRNITVNVCHPGAVATNFGQDADKGVLMNMIFKVALLFMDKPEQGAKTSAYLATSPDVEGLTGKFFGKNANEEKADHRYYSAGNEQKVWDYCMEALKAYL